MNNEEYSKIQNETVIFLRDVNQKLTEENERLKKEIEELKKQIKEYEDEHTPFLESDFSQEEIKEIESLQESLSKKSPYITKPLEFTEKDLQDTADHAAKL